MDLLSKHSHNMLFLCIDIHKKSCIITIVIKIKYFLIKSDGGFRPCEVRQPANTDNFLIMSGKVPIPAAKAPKDEGINAVFSPTSYDAGIFIADIFLPKNTLIKGSAVNLPISDVKIQINFHLLLCL